MYDFSTGTFIEEPTEQFTIQPSGNRASRSANSIDARESNGEPSQPPIDQVQEQLGNRRKSANTYSSTAEEMQAKHADETTADKYSALKEYVTQRKKDYHDVNVIDLKNNYSITSVEREKAKPARLDYIRDHLTQVQDILSDQRGITYTDPITGAEISNATRERIWVSQNVGFIFSTGAVFDKHDKAFMDELYSYFDVHSQQYLGCYHFIYSYETDLVKKLERLQAISNGNYHMCVFVIVYADKKYLDDAPEPLFGHSGIVETLIERNDIRDELMRIMIKYGFTKVIRVQPTPESHIGKNKAQTLPDIYMQYDTEVDFNKTSRELFSNLRQKDNSMIGTRTKINGNVDGKRSHGRTRRMKSVGQRGDNLENQIEYDTYVSYTGPSDIHGISPRINNQILTMANNTVENQQQQVFQLYDDESDRTTIPYSFGNDTSSIPSFNVAAYRIANDM